MALVFAIASAVLAIAVGRGVGAYSLDANREAVASEISILVGEERARGRAELIDAVNRHERAVIEQNFRFLLVDRSGAVLAGHLPTSMAFAGWSESRLRVCTAGDDCVVSLLADGVTLADGSTLVVAADTSDLADLRRRLSGYTIFTGMGITVFVLVGGFIVGRLFLRRLDAVNHAIDRIVAGRLAERLPSIGMGPEFDRLSANLNAMLDRIEMLMDGLRQVSVDVAHDLRTPLTRLRQRLERLEGDVPRVLRNEVRGIIAQADHVLDIFAALLRIGAMESGSSEKRFTRVDLAALLWRIATAYGPEIEDGGRSLSVDIPSEAAVCGDETLLAQGIANLVENAAAHTPEGTSIRLSLRVGHRAYAVVVEDDGPGIPPDEREKVTRRFYRLDRSRSTAGAGLGLALVEAIARVHGGGLVLGSAGPGLQATIELPAA